MSDIVERLRQPAVFGQPAEGQRCVLVMAEAADEIVRLNERIGTLAEQLGVYQDCFEDLEDIGND